MPDTPRTLQHYAPEELPREKAVRHGCRVLTSAELLALILRVGTQGHSIMDLTRDLMAANNNSLHQLMRRTREEILTVPGIGMTKAIQIEAVMALVGRYMEEEKSETRPRAIRQSSDIFEEMRFLNANSPQEQIWLLTLNRANRIIARHHLTTGSAVASVFDLKRALKMALLDEASSVILCHNHPSGNLRPSPQDDQITRALAQACSTMELRVLDHIIVTADGYYSYADQGRL
ncbi:MAG: DNA repair protein RadC [Bacteroides sp.]|nr:DNA repair protein RadC [Bacteroides sp.]